MVIKILYYYTAGVQVPFLDLLVSRNLLILDGKFAMQAYYRKQNLIHYISWQLNLTQRIIKRLFHGL